MAFFIAPTIYILLFNGLVWVTIGNELPSQCSGSTDMICYPVIPSFVPFYGWNLPNIERLALNNGNGLQWSLQTLPTGLFNWAKTLKSLDMRNVGLEHLECDVFLPLRNSLSSISMDRNLFRELPSCSLKNLKKLEYLHFSNQIIESVNMNDMELNSLSHIYLRQNKISNLSISNINNINNINIFLENNEITYLDISLVNQIHSLFAKENQLTKIHHGIFYNSHSTLATLDLSHNALDDDVWNVLDGVTSLAILQLQNNRLQTVSSSVINRLSELYKLDLSHNHIKSLADVRLRSGKMSNVLFNSNKLVNFPSNLIDHAYTYGNDYFCKLDISNNKMDNLQIDIPLHCTGWTLNLSHNELSAVHFKNNDNTIYHLDISNNLLATLPETLPKASRYIISNNPLNTTNVLRHLKTTMKEATEIDMDNTNFLCNRNDFEYNDFTNLQFLQMSTLKMRGNCIPILFLCYVERKNIKIYLDRNKNIFNSTEDMPCELHNKEFGIVSFSSSRINEMLVNLFMSRSTKTISNVISLYFKKSQLKELSFLRYRCLSYYHTHIFDFSKNFLKVFNGLEIMDFPYHFTLNLEHNQITKFKKITIRRNNPTYYVRYIFLKYMNNSIGIVNDNASLIEIVGEYRQIDISIDLSFNKIYKINLATIFITSYNSLLAVENLNVSHNDLEEYHNCLQNVTYIQILDFSYNKLRDLPDNSCRYGYNTYLGHNRITEISKTLPTANINKLDLEWNLIQFVSEKAFINITSLMTLNLKGNKLENFPKAVQKLRYLTTLDISYNEIQSFKQSDIGEEMIHLTLLILTGNDLAPHASAPIDLLMPLPGLRLKDNRIYCKCDILFLRNHTLNAYGRCSFPSEFEGYQVSCFPADNCVGNVPIYVYKETRSRCLKDDYFDIKISMLKIDEILSVRWKRLGPLKQTGIKMKVYRKQILVKEILVNDTGQTNCIFLPHNLDANRLCMHAYLNDRTFERCVDINHTKISGNSNYLSEKSSNNGAIYGTSAALVLSVLLNIFGSIFIFVFIRKKWPTNEANSNQFANNAYVPNEYEMSTARHGENHQQLDVYDQLSENSNNNTGGSAYENLDI